MDFGPAKIRYQNNLNVVTIPIGVMAAMKLKKGDQVMVRLEKVKEE